MKKSALLTVFLAVILFSHNFSVVGASAEVAAAVPHFFTHALIADVETAFAAGNPMRADYDRDCLTASEFEKILYRLYDGGYALADIDSVYTGKLRTDKKPMLLSFDDINYYVKKMRLGMNDRLVVTEDGKIAAQLKGEASFDSECIPILESFIEAHPDFSIDGARAVICLTGFDGILGYRTNRQSQNLRSERAAAKKVVAALKNKGYKFACHSYGHRHMKNISLEVFESDTDKWQNEVASIVGKTNLYCYPYGEWTMDEKQSYLLKKGYEVFFGVGMDPYCASMPLDNGRERCYFMDRIALDGRTLRTYREKLSRYFDAENVFDSRRVN